MKGFVGLKIAVSCRSKKRGAGEEDLNFKKMVKMVGQVGAIHSNTVHKRVAYVVSTEDAYKGKTQRVRKAAKYKIPVVKLEWLQECIGSKKMLDFHPFVLGDDHCTAHRDPEKGNEASPALLLKGNVEAAGVAGKGVKRKKKEKKEKKKKNKAS